MAGFNNIEARQNLSALVDFSNVINSSLDLQFTLSNILLTCFGKLHTTKGFAALVDSDKKLKIELYKGIQKVDIDTFPNVYAESNGFTKNFYEFLETHNFPLYQNIVSPQGLIGIVVLGEQLSKKKYSADDEEFLRVLVNIGSAAIENSTIISKLKNANKSLDGKVNQMSVLFELSKEFSGTLKTKMIGKLLVFSIIGQLLVSKFAVIGQSKGMPDIWENKFDDTVLKPFASIEMFDRIESSLSEIEVQKNFPELYSIGVRLILPSRLKSKTVGLIFLGERKNKLPFSDSDIEFASSVGGLAAIATENSRLFEEAIEKQKLEKEMETARKIQQNLLPKSMPKLGSFEIAAINKSARKVGGDYYDLIKLQEHETLFAIGDVSGKGVQAALLMANLQAFIKSIWKQNLALDKASNLLNNLVSENTTDGSFITFFWGILNDESKYLEYCNAGHNPPLLIRNGKIIYLTNGGMILGVLPTITSYVSTRIELLRDDLIILFTDGITEAMDKDFNEYTDERLEDLAVNVSNSSAEEVLNIILKDVKKHTRGAEQSDDITALIIKVKK